MLKSHFKISANSLLEFNRLTFQDGAEQKEETRNVWIRQAWSVLMQPDNFFRAA